MFFHFGRNETFLFESIRTDSPAHVFAACLVVFVACILQESFYLILRRLTSSGGSNIREADRGSRSRPESCAVSWVADSVSSDDIPLPPVAVPSTLTTSFGRPTANLSLQATTTSPNSTHPSASTSSSPCPTWAFDSCSLRAAVRQAAQAGLRCTRLLLTYVLMLVVMTGDARFFASALLGSAVGYFCFRYR